MKIKKLNHTLCKIHKKEYCEDSHCFWEGQERMWSLFANQWLHINVAHYIFLTLQQRVTWSMVNLKGMQL